MQTEKFFGSLCSGTVPVYLGAPNCKFFAPDVGDVSKDDLNAVNSIIYTGDYDFDAEKLANVMIDLVRNETEYFEKLRWKKIGFSGDFQALFELTSVHTSCRQCILAADRRRLNEHVFSPDFDSAVFTYVFGKNKKNDLSERSKIYFIRERGNYRFYQFVWYLSQNEKMLDFVRFVTDILRVMHRRRTEYNTWKNNKHPNYHRIGPALYGVYLYPQKTAVTDTESLNSLPNYSELEVIFT